MPDKRERFSPETRVLHYFESESLDKVEIMYNLIRDVVRIRRTPTARTASRRKAKAPDDRQVRLPEMEQTA